MNDMSMSLTSQQWRRQDSESNRVTLRGLRSLELVLELSSDSSAWQGTMTHMRFTHLHISMDTWADPHTGLQSNLDNEKASEKNTLESSQLWSLEAKRTHFILLEEKPLS